MKKQQRDRILEDLFKRLNDKDFDEMQYALFQLALILERSTQPDEDSAETYEENLDRHMLRLRLNPTEQGDIIERMTRLAAANYKARASVFWAMQRAEPSIVRLPLLSLLVAAGKGIQGPPAVEAVRALDRAFPEDSLDEGLIAHLRGQDPISLLEKWAESDDERLAGPAGRVLERLKAVL